MRSKLLAFVLSVLVLAGQANAVTLDDYSKAYVEVQISFFKFLGSVLNMMGSSDVIQTNARALAYMSINSTVTSYLTDNATLVLLSAVSSSKSAEQNISTAFETLGGNASYIYHLRDNGTVTGKESIKKNASQYLAVSDYTKAQEYGKVFTYFLRGYIIVWTQRELRIHEALGIVSR